MRRVIRLIVGSIVMGGGIAIAMKGGFGVDPMALFWEGIHIQTGMSYGTANLLVSGVIILMLFFIDRSQLGIGTVVNSVLVSLSMDLISLLPLESELFLIRLFLLLIGLVLLAGGIVYYGSANFGRGAFDGLIFGIVNKTKYTIRMIRSSFDLILVILGMLLGAKLSLGPIVSVLTIGYMMQFFHTHLRQIDEK
ncbi:YczE/YyaS/YitT family protein [Traorella massiliensis]|uniref:YczE/YyaS/YitT family protein n=1 Tax=Traorella massiliensis TaxID=1903263 RepID=UPI0008F955D1|nr:hypothetical protein [Traorella massiliensis]